MPSKYYKTYEPLFLLDHIEFGSQFRLFKANAFDMLLKQYEGEERREEIKFITLALFAEEMASYEDLGCLLYAIKKRMEEKKTPIIQTLHTYNASSAILHKMFAQDNAESFIDSFHIKELLTDDVLPGRREVKPLKVQKGIGTILTTDFKKNTKPERIDAYYRMKHGSVLVSSLRKYTGSKYGKSNIDLPGVLLKTTELAAHKKKMMPSEIADTPFVPFGLKVGPVFKENTLKAITVSTQIQQLLCIAVLLKVHKGYLYLQGLDREDLMDKGLDIENLCIELSQV